ncbi:hypothetical protein VNO77_08121 [Canavalia gladiata]|uniref:Uncharacterized protein n=1 Tax=Canavalia gladiata TaxID=3824 RepID=A0AAN9M8B6_CANGL
MTRAKNEDLRTKSLLPFETGDAFGTNLQEEHETGSSPQIPSRCQRCSPFFSSTQWDLHRVMGETLISSSFLHARLLPLLDVFSPFFLMRASSRT